MKDNDIPWGKNALKLVNVTKNSIPILYNFLQDTFKTMSFDFRKKGYTRRAEERAEHLHLNKSLPRPPSEEV
jgi:hypothetical protein